MGLSVRSTLHKQAKVLVPSMFMEQDPQIPSLQERRKVKVGSISFFIFTNTSRTIGPHSLRLTLYVCINGFAIFSGFCVSFAVPSGRFETP